MRHARWMVVLATMFVAAGLAAQEPTTRSDEARTVEQMELRERELELKAHESELMHQQKLRDLDVEQRQLEIERLRNEGKEPGGGGGVLLLLILVVHILLTVWVWKDMREQEIGRALWVPIVLLTGMLGALLYAVVRVADTRAKPTQAEPKRAR